MTHRMRVAAPVPSAEGRDTATDPDRGQRLIALGLLVAVVLLDQTTKWWGWRYAPKAIINAGSTWLIGQPVNGWFSGSVSGPLLDVINCGLLSLAGYILVRRRRRVPVLVAGALMIAGWSSNLLDRLGMHHVTAPDSVRGAVDFIQWGRPCLNLADVVIVGSTVLLLIARCVPGSRTGRGAAPTRYTTPVTRRRPLAPVRAWATAAGLVAAMVLGMAAATGSAADGGVRSSPRSSAEAGAHA